MQQPQHILVIRFSAMGDVAMTVPVIKNVLQQNPQLKITVVSNAFLQPLFQNIERCNFYPANLKGKHKGIKGIYQLVKELKILYKFTAIADLHNVLRSSLIKIFYTFNYVKIATLDKGRQQKAELTRKENKVVQPLTPMHERYAEVFRRLGVVIKLDNELPVFAKYQLPEILENIFITEKQIIGIAPFAQHQEKMYPLSKMKNLVYKLTKENYAILLFGGGKKEANLLQQWADEIEGVHNMAGKFSFTEELAIIGNLNLMISMDSANMHLASLFGVKVISIWGATHPYAGFNGWGQKQQNIVQIDLYCRPCSVFGNKPCYRGDHACMNMISEEMIISKVAEV